MRRVGEKGRILPLRLNEGKLSLARQTPCISDCGPVLFAAKRNICKGNRKNKVAGRQVVVV